MEIKESGEKEFKIFKTVPESMKSVHFKNVLPYFLWWKYFVYSILSHFYYYLMGHSAIKSIKNIGIL